MDPHINFLLSKFVIEIILSPTVTPPWRQPTALRWATLPRWRKIAFTSTTFRWPPPRMSSMEAWPHPQESPKTQSPHSPNQPCDLKKITLKTASKVDLSGVPRLPSQPFYAHSRVIWGVNTTVTASYCTLFNASKLTKNSVHFNNISVAATSNVIYGSLGQT